MKKKYITYSTNPESTFPMWPTREEQREKMDTEGLLSQRERDIYFFGKWEVEKNENKNGNTKETSACK